MENLVSDPKLATLLTPQAMLFLGSLIAGLVQATRKLRIDSGWLPFISAAWGIVVVFFGSLLIGAGFDLALLGFVVLYGLSLGGATTGFVAVVVHATSGSTDGQSTTKLQ